MTVYNLFREQVQKKSDSICVEFGNRALTYKQLENEVNRMTSYLKNCGVKKGNIVGISLNRSVEMIISLLGIIKIGAIYVPLDPTFPSNRLQYMLEDSNCSHLITENSIAHSFGYYRGKLIEVNEYVNYEIDNFEEEVDEESIVYILYTSGSTGNPKGVQIRHKSLVNFLLSMRKTPGISSKDSLLAVTTLSFDISGLEIYLPLISGSKLVIASKEETMDGRQLLEKLKNVTVMQATPSTWKMLLESGWNKKLKLKALCGGEPLSRDLANKILEKVDELWNMYGPTETTIWSSCSKVEKGNGIIHLGKPIANTQFYIVDKNNQFCAPGVPGELLIGGDGLSTGYLNLEELTKEKFIDNPYYKENKSKLYKTGDLVKINQKYQIEFLGRIDNQVKIRGFRIELGEIEEAIKKNEFVKDCVTVVKEFAEEDKRIIAFYTINQSELSEEEDIDTKMHVEKWKNNYDKLYENSINNLKRGNDDLEIGYLVVQQFEQETNYREQFNVWINETIRRIRKLKPDRVLEIGCGGGDILKRIISDCSYYCATDLSPKIIEHLENDLKKLDKKISEVKLFALPADADLPLEKNHFDTLIMNSVAVYFPNEKYLTDVVNNLTTYLSDNGCFFIGDMQSYSLQKNLYLFEQLSRVQKNIRIKDFKKILENKIQTAPEFFIDPIYFFNLTKTNPKIRRVEIKLMRGSLENDPSTYHYDIFLNPGLHKEISNNVKTLEWSNLKDITIISHILSNEKPEILYLKDIPNKRIMSRIKTQEAIDNANPDDLLFDVVNSIKHSNLDVNPEDIWNLENEVKYSIDLVLPENNSQLYFDAIFVAKELEDKAAYPLRKIEKSDNTQIKYCNEPVSTFSHDHLNAKIKESISAILPDYMNPSFIIQMELLPLTPNNKIDRNALINYKIADFTDRKSLQEPKKEIEKKLLELWESVLDIKGIGVDDGFFELGGHSILAISLIYKLNKQFNIDLPLSIIFNAPTISKLSNEIEKIKRFEEKHN